MPDPRIVAAWKAEQLRQQRPQRQRLAYWLSIGEVYLILTALTLGFFGGASLLVSLNQ